MQSCGNDPDLTEQPDWGWENTSDTDEDQREANTQKGSGILLSWLFAQTLRDLMWQEHCTHLFLCILWNMCTVPASVVWQAQKQSMIQVFFICPAVTQKQESDCTNSNSPNKQWPGQSRTASAFLSTCLVSTSKSWTTKQMQSKTTFALSLRYSKMQSSHTPAVISVHVVLSQSLLFIERKMLFYSARSKRKNREKKFMSTWGTLRRQEHAPRSPQTEAFKAPGCEMPPNYNEYSILTKYLSESQCLIIFTIQNSRFI